MVLIWTKESIYIVYRNLKNEEKGDGDTSMQGMREKGSCRSGIEETGSVIT